MLGFTSGWHKRVRRRLLHLRRRSFPPPLQAAGSSERGQSNERDVVDRFAALTLQRAGVAGDD